MIGSPAFVLLWLLRSKGKHWSPWTSSLFRLSPFRFGVYKNISYQSPNMVPLSLWTSDNAQSLSLTFIWKIIWIWSLISTFFFCWTMISLSSIKRQVAFCIIKALPWRCSPNPYSTIKEQWIYANFRLINFSIKLSLY